MAKRYMKSCLTSLIISKVKIKTAMRYHFISVRIVIKMKKEKRKCWQGCGEKGTCVHC